MSSSLPSRSIPFISHSMMMEALPPAIGPSLIRGAYATLYNRGNPPVKSVFPSTEGIPTVLFMPFCHSQDGCYFEKTLFIDSNRRPGVWGHATMSNVGSTVPRAIFDATTLTGIRTAAKSVLFAMVYFAARHQTPQSILIYGASTQAFHHAIQFRDVYPNAQIYIMARSALSCGNIAEFLLPHGQDFRCVTNDDVHIQPDIIVTATSSPVPIVTEMNLRSAQLLIAVGSSKGDTSEVAPSVVAKSYCVVDARVSITGKGELQIPLQSGLIQAADITELADFLVNGAQHLIQRQKPCIFVSKGLVIEDYVVARWFLEHFRI